MIETNSNSYVIHPVTGVKIMLSEQEKAAKKEYLEGWAVRERQYDGIFKSCLQGPTAHYDDTPLDF